MIAARLLIMVVMMLIWRKDNYNFDIMFILTYYVCMNFGIRLLELSSADHGCLNFYYLML